MIRPPRQFRQKTLKIIIRGDNIFLDNYFTHGSELVKKRYYNKIDLLQQIKELIDLSYNDIINTAQKRRERIQREKTLKPLRKGNNDAINKI